MSKKFQGQTTIQPGRTGSDKRGLSPRSSAFVYGSVAAGTETSRSDVDVMILGELPFAEAVKALP